MPPQEVPAQAPAQQAAPVTIIGGGEHHHLGRIPLLIGGLMLVVLIAAGAYWFVTPSTAPVTQEPKRIGIAYFRQGLTSVEGLKEGMAKLGYTDADVEYIEEEIHIGPDMEADMKAAFKRMIEEERVDLIWEDHEQQAKAAVDFTKEMGYTTPIVFLARFHDPVEYGIVLDYKSSGNNATGVVQNLTDVASRNLSFFREIDPDVRKVGVFSTGFLVPGVGDAYLEELKRQAERLGFEMVDYTTDVPPPQAENAFHEIAAGINTGDIDALIHIPGHFFETQESAEYELAKRLGIPHYAPKEDLPGGGHFSYSSDFRYAGEQSASLVDQIFRGARPSDIPIETGRTVDLTLVLPRAAETGIEFSESMLYIAKTKIGE